MNVFVTLGTGRARLACCLHQRRQPGIRWIQKPKMQQADFISRTCALALILLVGCSSRLATVPIDPKASIATNCAGGDVFTLAA